MIAPHEDYRRAICVRSDGVLKVQWNVGLHTDLGCDVPALMPHDSRFVGKFNRSFTLLPVQQPPSCHQENNYEDESQFRLCPTTRVPGAGGPSMIGKSRGAHEQVRTS